jgi:hypothetical protein
MVANFNIFFVEPEAEASRPVTLVWTSAFLFESGSHIEMAKHNIVLDLIYDIEDSLSSENSSRLLSETILAS